MRDRVAFAVLFVFVIAATVGFHVFTADLPAEAMPDATFDVEVDFEADELVVEHAGGDSLESGSVRILVYEDRPVIPDRPVHGSTWESDPLIQSGDRLTLEDPRFEPGQRLIVRWFSEDGQGNIYETEI